MITIRNIISTACLSLAFMAGAQASVVSFRITGTPGDIPVTLNVRSVEATDPQAGATVNAPEAGGVYKASVEPSASGLYYIYAYNSEAGFQTQMPVYIPSSHLGGDTPVSLSVRDGVLLHCDIDDAANRDIYACALNFLRQSRSMSDWAKSSDNTVLLSHLRTYISVADSALTASPVPAQVADFIRLWAYSTASDAFRLMHHIRNRADLSTTVSSGEILPDPRTVLDNDMAATFGSTASNISATLTGTLPEKLAKLHADYTNPRVIAAVTDMLLESYVRGYKYDNGAQPGLDLLAGLESRYGISPKWAARLKASEATMPGTPFPDGVTLLDTEGNTVPFSEFLGKWVYIDLWASWCGPCVREIPHLQELEKTLQGAPVTFVSISLDSSRDAWLKKVAALDLHGNQLIDSDGALAKALNISGIPHFLLYNPEGKLAIYKASRPSDPKTFTQLQSLK